MSRYDVKHTCGHEVEYQLFGKHTDRERKLSWYATQACPDCRKAAATAAAVCQNTGDGLPPLTGTEKQIAWAESIRAAWLASARESGELELLQKIAANPAADADNRAAAEWGIYEYNRLRERTSAGEWIQDRNTGGLRDRAARRLRQRQQQVL